MNGDRWRVEADDEWLASHSSDNFARMRRRARLGLGDAISNSVLAGTVFSPQRNPKLRFEKSFTEQIRYAERHYSYTAINVDLRQCRMCGRRSRVTHNIAMVGADGRRTIVGEIYRCRSCHADSWMFRSRMPRTRAGLARDRKVVL
jgi:hypothetical protein